MGLYSLSLPRPVLGHVGLRSHLLSQAYDLVNVICLAQGLCVRDRRKLKIPPIKLQSYNSITISSNVRKGCGPLSWRIERLEELAHVGRVKELGFVVLKRKDLEVIDSDF